jgi:thiamine kinase-like enzyme
MSGGSSTIDLSATIPLEDRALLLELLADWGETVTGLTSASVDLLEGGANNRNYRVVIDGRERYALRIANTLSDRLAVDRVSGQQAQRDAAKIGVAPALVAARLPEGHLLSAFVHGRTLASETIRQPDVLERIGRTLRRLHGGTTAARPFSAFDDVRKWKALIAEDGSWAPPDFDDLCAEVGRVEAALGRVALPKAFCHNDTVPQNFLETTEGSIVLVDWDYGGPGLASFEVASFCATAELDEAGVDAFLWGYDQLATDAQRATIRVLGLVAAVREVSWAAMAKPYLVGNTDVPASFYDEYLDQHLSTARRIAGADGFGGLLTAAAAHAERSW